MSENNLQVQSEQKKENKWQKIIATYLANTNTKLTLTQLDEFVMLCRENNLNPLKREVYAVTYTDYQTQKTTMNIVTNYYEYLKRADATGLLNGYEIDIDLEKGIGLFVGYRKDWIVPLKMKFFLKEWKQINKKTGKPIGLWETKEYFMFEKCILANGLRRLFPNELGNMPYISEELWYQNKQNEEQILQNIALEENKLPEPKLNENEIKKVIG